MSITFLHTLEKYYQDGLVLKQKHPFLDLLIWNYSPKVQYDKLWDDVTIRCRGLITDTDGNVIIQPFKKFFNYEEVVDKIPTNNDYVYVQEKMDGSLGIFFNYKNEWIMATRGSFISEQAIKGLKLLSSKYNLSSWMKEYAYLVEIIYPENRIVVDYGEDKITFLSVVLNESYKWDNPIKSSELHWTTANSIFYINGIEKSDIVKTEQYFNFSNDLYKSLKNKNEENKEGYVLIFFPSYFRVKIKFEEYVRLHKILTNISNRIIWEYLKDHKSFDELIKNVPDEFYDWVKVTADNLIDQYAEIEKNSLVTFNDIFKKIDTNDRKSFALEAVKCDNPSILFSMLDKRDYEHIIWKLIYPQYTKPFKNYAEEN